MREGEGEGTKGNTSSEEECGGKIIEVVEEAWEKEKIVSWKITSLETKEDLETRLYNL